MSGPKPNANETTFDEAGPARKAASLALWSGPVDPRPVRGGITNANFVVEDGGRRYFVRIGEDIPVHGVLRWNELAADRGGWRAMLWSGEAPEGFRQAPPPPVPMPISHFLVRPRRAAAVRTNAAIDASLRGENVRR